MSRLFSRTHNALDLHRQARTPAVPSTLRASEERASQERLGRANPPVLFRKRHMPVPRWCQASRNRTAARRAALCVPVAA